MIDIKVKTNFSKVPEFRAAVERGLKKGVAEAAVILQRQMKDILQNGAGGAREQRSLPNTPPMNQRGNLRRSMFTAPGPGLTAFAGSKEFYAGVLETGKTITPKNGKYLAVPMSPAGQRLSESTVGGLKNAPTKMKVIKAKGKLFLVATESNTKKGSRKINAGAFLFVLKKSVTIKPRPWANPSVKLAASRMVAAFSRVAGGSIRSEVLSSLKRGVSGGGDK